VSLEENEGTVDDRYEHWIAFITSSSENM